MTQLLDAPAIETSAPEIDFDELLRPAARPARLKLSEAIRRGAALTDPAIGQWEGLSQHYRMKTCAIGAACYVAAGEKRSLVGSLKDAARYFPELEARVSIDRNQVSEYVDAPEGTLSWQLGDHIMHLNDILKVDRVRIAEIVAALGY
jgi:hypothetical protein